MKVASYFPIVLVLALAMLAPSAFAQVKAEEQLLPELGIYVDIDEDEWDAAKVNLRIVDNNFQMYFLDENNLLVDADVDKVIVHYGNFIKDSNARFTLVLKKEGLMYTSVRVIPPPHRYMVRIFLKKTVEPEVYYKEAYEEKEFIGMHTLNQLGSEFLEATRTQPYSEPLAKGEKEGEALPDTPDDDDNVNQTSAEVAKELAETEQEEEFTRMPPKKAPNNGEQEKRK